MLLRAHVSLMIDTCRVVVTATALRRAHLNSPDLSAVYTTSFPSSNVKNPQFLYHNLHSLADCCICVRGSVIVHDRSCNHDYYCLFVTRRNGIPACWPGPRSYIWRSAEAGCYIRSALRTLRNFNFLTRSPVLSITSYLIGSVSLNHGLSRSIT
ncbi:hypothetical protein BC835DRAFT_65537 [Cytidiella melzeri]|nr:hypothetical protein BC835DRAFT_65537 [Cytidiella melzeri]